MSEFESFLGDIHSNGSSDDPDDLFSDVSDPVAAEPEPLTENPIEGDGQCVVCGAPTYRPPGLTRGGYRHRVPKFCELHARRQPQSSSQPTGDPSILTGELKRIQAELDDEVALVGMFTAPLFPTTGYYIVENADAVTTAILELCRHNPKYIAAARRVAQLTPFYRILKFGAGVGMSVQVDQGKIDPHNRICEGLGVTRAYRAVHNEAEPTPPPMTNPPRYATVQ